MKRTLQDFYVLILVLGAALAVGMYVGRLEQRITHLESMQQYIHGTFEVPGAK